MRCSLLFVGPHLPYKEDDMRTDWIQGCLLVGLIAIIVGLVEHRGPDPQSPRTLKKELVLYRYFIAGIILLTTAAILFLLPN
ncbi:MAG: hypothetical protein JWO96_51 [Candidatus Saccharibacteria bacterium]|nr:hypothetical protein [Candidatus Saccharibacteria bacterium]